MEKEVLINGRKYGIAIRIGILSRTFFHDANDIEAN